LKSDVNNTPSDAADIEFQSVRKAYGDVLAIDNMNLSIPQGAFISFLGPSGCGKTTSLRLIGGFEQPTSGNVFLRGKNVVGVPPYQRPINMVFQHYALFPHLNVAENIAYGVKQQQPNLTPSELSRKVGEALEMVQLGGYEKRNSWEMSGGQQQRVALARALVNRPNVLLLDEPLAALDRKLRSAMQIELQNLQRDVGITFILVTHDQEEALSMSDTVCIMEEGKIVQTGSPSDLYNEPCNTYVADFVGKSNFFEGIATTITSKEIAISLDNGIQAKARKPIHAKDLIEGCEAVFSIRPELTRIFSPDSTQIEQVSVSLAGRVTNRIFLGEHTEYVVQTEELGDVMVLAPRLSELGAGSFESGQNVVIGWSNDSARILAKSN
jgi:spermidine/putrescine transport system ATP-binding protein